MLFILGIVAIIVFTYQAYKTAVATDRNAPLWAVLTACIGIVFQIVVPFFIGLAIAIYYLLTGTPQEKLESEIFGLAVILNIACLILSIVGMVLVTKHVSKVRDDIPSAPTPAPSGFVDQSAGHSANQPSQDE